MCTWMIKTQSVQLNTSRSSHKRETDRQTDRHTEWGSQRQRDPGMTYILSKCTAHVLHSKTGGMPPSPRPSHCLVDYIDSVLNNNLYTPPGAVSSQYTRLHGLRTWTRGPDLASPSCRVSHGAVGGTVTRDNFPERTHARMHARCRCHRPHTSSHGPISRYIGP